MSTYLFRNTMQDAFDRVATEAIEQGLLTTAECDTIKRHGTRKQFNYVRQLEDLCAYIEYKQRKENHKHDAKRGSHI